MTGLITSMPFQSSMALVDQDAHRRSPVTISRITLLSTRASTSSPRQLHDLVGAQSRGGPALHLPYKGTAPGRFVHFREVHLSVGQELEFHFRARPETKFIPDFERNRHLSFRCDPHRAPPGYYSYLVSNIAITQPSVIYIRWQSTGAPGEVMVLRIC